ncbi:hypothetical protein GIB67_036136 [Kingdonia uniflora]|uniref:FAD-binding domain-containing protein n=1 Tax=Kingdonia uniflora TaxID=39325 RepID=A0A7J7N963_9MAGN|nr:hypothetical protein GIB67_036136 [Kingdonia uniflora]
MEMKEDVVIIGAGNVVIIGAGIAGLATALALKRVGIRALVLEKSPELRTTGGGITLFTNAWLALDALGVSNKLNSFYAPYKGGFVTDVRTGRVQAVSYTRADGTKSGPRTLHRRDLLEALAEELPTGTIRFSIKISNPVETCMIDGSPIAILYLDDGTIISAKVLIGCDGVHSMIARWLGLGNPINSGRWAARGLAIYPQDDELTTGDPKLIQKNVLESSIDIPEVFLDVVRQSDMSNVTWAPLLFRVPWNLIFGKLSNGNITIAGDAMHPMTPDLGQGGCSALEDAVVLARHIGNSFHEHQDIIPAEVSKAIELYVKERRWHSVALITGSYLSGWVQHTRSGWFTKFFREKIFYKFLYGRVAELVRYDCGKLPCIPSPMDGKVD